MRACIHRERAAERPGNAGKKFRRPEAPANTLPCQLCARHAYADPHALVFQALQVIENSGCRDDHARNTTVAHQQITAQAKPENRHLPSKLLQKS